MRNEMDALDLVLKKSNAYAKKLREKSSGKENRYG